MDALNTDTRKGRGFAIFQAKGSKIREVIQGKYLVPSQSSSGSYLVDMTARSCTCPDWEALGGHGREHTCKHLYAVLVVRREVTMPDGSSVILSEQHVTYPQAPNYKKARMYEKELVMQLLAGLCATVPQPPYKGDGRPALPLGDVIFMGVLKVYTTLAGDLAHTDTRWAKEKGLITAVPHPNTMFRVLREPSTIPVLRHLIEQSTLPLRAVETDFASDGTGISTKSYVRWFDKKWGKEMREERWLGLKVMVGVKTGIITAAEVTPGNKHDSRYLPGLLKATAKNFEVKKVAADMGFLSKRNFKAIQTIAPGATTLIPFRVTDGLNGNPLWDRAYAYFVLHREEFYEEYGIRNRSEAAFSSLKRVLFSTVRAKSENGQIAEIYTKVLAANLRILVQAIFNMGIEPSFWMKPTTEVLQ